MCALTVSKLWVLHVADQFRPPLRPVLDKPLRLCMTDVFKAVGAGVAVAGMIHTGSVQVGDRVVVVPAGDTAIVKGSVDVYCLHTLIDGWSVSGRPVNFNRRSNRPCNQQLAKNAFLEAQLTLNCS